MLVHQDRAKLKRYKDFKLWAKHISNLERLRDVHKSVRLAICAHMYDDCFALNGSS